jgi:hypothetical protein
MAAGDTYEKIQTNTLTSTTATVTFTSISGAYTDLILIINAADTTSNSNAALVINGDTSSNYSRTNLTGNGSTASSTKVSNASNLYITPAIGTGTNFTTNWVITFQNYSNTTTNKNILVRGNQAIDSLAVIAGLWRSTAAITSLDIQNQGTAWKIGSTFTLYGIAAA